MIPIQHLSRLAFSCLAVSATTMASTGWSDEPQMSEDFRHGVVVGSAYQAHGSAMLCLSILSVMDGEKDSESDPVTQALDRDFLLMQLLNNVACMHDLVELPESVEVNISRYHWRKRLGSIADYLDENEPELMAMKFEAGWKRRMTDDLQEMGLSKEKIQVFTSSYEHRLKTVSMLKRYRSSTEDEEPQKPAGGTVEKE